MRDCLFRKGLVVGIIVLFIGAGVTPSISGNVSKMNDIKDVETRTINDAIQTNEREPYTVFTTDWWSMFHHDLNHSGYSTSDAPDTNNVIWNYTTGGDLVYPSPAVSDGKVYVGSHDYKVYCLDANNGSMIWIYNTGGYVMSSPAFSDGKVYVASYNYKVYCLDANNGSMIWDYSTGRYVFSSPAVSDGKVYVGSYDDKVYCLDADTGDFIWSYTTGHNVLSSPAVSDGKVYVGSYDDKVYCLDADDGSMIWDYTTGDYVFSSPAIADGKVYVGSFDDNVYCLDADTGDFIWSYSTGDDVRSSPAVADGKVYIGSWDDKVYCLDADDGSMIWDYTTGGLVRSSPAVSDGKVYVGSHDYKVYCLDADDGSMIWDYTTGGSVFSSPAIADGKVYVGSHDDDIYCFGRLDHDVGVKEITEPSGPPEPWPPGTYPVEAIVKNYGSQNESNFNVNATIWLTTRDDELFYHDDVMVNTTMNYSDEVVVKFDNVTFLEMDEGDYRLEVATELASDENPNNDVYQAAFTVIEDTPPDKPTIDGPTSGTVGVTYDYTVSSTDPDGDDIAYYLILWDDDTHTNKTGPFASGEIVTASHKWTKKGTYTILARATDVFGKHSPWGLLDVTMPRNRMTTNTLISFLEQFPILRHLLLQR